MAKLQLDAAPTFTAKVGIPVPGGDAAPVLFTFRHRTQTDFAKWLKELDGKDKAKAVVEMTSAWDLEDAFDESSIKRLLSNYMGAFDAILSKYVDELTGARRGN